MSKTTPILLTTTVLSKAVDAILAACPTPAPGQRALTKSHLLNILAKAIAGPKHDWGFLTGAVDTVVARGVAQPAAVPTPASEVFFYQYDERDDWSRAPRGPFATRAELLAHLADDHWWHSDDYPAEQVIKALETQDEFTFYGSDDDDDGDASPYAITIFRYAVPTAQAAPAPQGPTPPAEPQVGYQIMDATGDIYAPENGYAPATFELFADKADAQAFIDRQPEAVRGTLTIATVQAADIEDPNWV